MTLGNIILDAMQGKVWQDWSLTLFHFIWQATAVLFLAFAMLRLLRHAQAHLRYVVCLTAMVVLVACPIVTFMVVDSQPAAFTPTTSAIDSSSGQTATPIESHSDASHDRLSIETPFVAPSIVDPTALSEADRAALAALIGRDEHASTVSNAASPSDQAAGSASTHIALQPWLLLIWLIGVVLMSVRLIAAAIGVQLMKRDDCALPAHIQPTLAKLCERMGMTRLPGIVVSRRVREAAVVGFFKPVLLLPASWATQMPTDMLEAVIAHELAHIRRFDLWINLFQRVIETTFFFHPAVWWLSRRMRIERELCCDAAAVQATDDRLVFAQTLEFVACQRMAGVGSALTLQIGGSSMPVLQRVKHVLGIQSNHDSHWLGGIVTMALPILIVAGSLNVFPSFFDAPQASVFAADEAREGDEREERREREELKRENKELDRERRELEREEKELEREKAELDRERRDGDKRREGDRERAERDRPREGDRDREHGEREHKDGVGDRRFGGDPFGGEGRSGDGRNPFGDAVHDGNRERGDSNERNQIERHLRELQSQLEALHNQRRKIALQRGEDDGDVRELSRAIEKLQSEVKRIHQHLEGNRNRDRDRGEGDRDRPRDGDRERAETRGSEGERDRPNPEAIERHMRELHNRMERLQKARRDVARERGENHPEVRELSQAIEQTEKQMHETRRRAEEMRRGSERGERDPFAERPREDDRRAQSREQAEQMARLISMVRELREENAKLRREMQEIRRHLGREGARNAERDRSEGEGARREGERREGDGDRRERERD